MDGNPLADIANAHRVKRVIANGRDYTIEALLSAPAGSGRQSSGRADR